MHALHLGFKCPDHCPQCPVDDSAVDDFAVLLLKELGYMPIGREDKGQGDTGNPVPQLVAEAIGAFHYNNKNREQMFGLPRLPSKVVPGITMQGSAPTFFKVPVSQELVEAVMEGVDPATETIVYAHLLSIPRPLERLNEGMKPVDNRLIMSCYEAFRQFLN
ncbi:hypothetical protein DFH07DRAFT_1023649 [Mycena maculata]|uniref:Uncharacterized protein n=1 Tax=Mycena maculata TaxID=230809 RepID=A0AAD7NG41_9AGAR|nr:hypothetical protein DFH07DRAFT_1023649 [Mycena maculata]